MQVRPSFQHSILLQSLSKLFASNYLKMLSYLLFVFVVKLAVISAEVDKVNNLTDLNNRLNAAESKLIVLSFTAEWCGPCRMMTPEVVKLSREFTDVIFLMVDADESADISNEYGIKALPTFVLIKNSNKIADTVGASKVKLRQLIEANE